MANPTQTQTPSTAPEFDRKEITRLFARIKDETTQLINDAGRSHPYYAPTKDKAEAKRDAAVKALNQLAETIDRLKKEGN